MTTLKATQPASSPYPLICLGKVSLRIFNHGISRIGWNRDRSLHTGLSQSEHIERACEEFFELPVGKRVKLLRKFCDKRTGLLASLHKDRTTIKISDSTRARFLNRDQLLPMFTKIERGVLISRSAQVTTVTAMMVYIENHTGITIEETIANHFRAPKATISDINEFAA